MDLEIAVAAAGADPAWRRVDAATTLGGSQADGLFVPGLPPGAVRLVPAPGGLVIEPSASGLRAAGHPVPPGVRRLLRGGERAELRGAVLALRTVAPPPDGTRIAAAALLRDAAAGATPSAARLVVLTGPAAGAVHPLGPEQTVGRGRGAAIRLPDPRASRVHARIRVDGRGASVEDLGSKNGVRVSGIRLEPRRPTPLRAGDELQIGDTALAVEEAWPEGADPEGAAQPGPSGAPSHVAAAALLALAAAALALAAS